MSSEGGSAAAAGSSEGDSTFERVLPSLSPLRGFCHAGGRVLPPLHPFTLLRRVLPLLCPLREDLLLLRPLRRVLPSLHALILNNDTAEVFPRQGQAMTNYD